MGESDALHAAFPADPDGQYHTQGMRRMCILGMMAAFELTDEQIHRNDCSRAPGTGGHAGRRPAPRYVFKSQRPAAKCHDLTRTGPYLSLVQSGCHCA